jgi:hypothetical protein
MGFPLRLSLGRRPQPTLCTGEQCPSSVALSPHACDLLGNRFELRLELLDVAAMVAHQRADDVGIARCGGQFRSAVQEHQCYHCGRVNRPRIACASPYGSLPASTLVPSRTPVCTVAAKGPRGVDQAAHVPVQTSLLASAVAIGFVCASEVPKLWNPVACKPPGPPHTNTRMSFGSGVRYTRPSGRIRSCCSS